MVLQAQPRLVLIGRASGEVNHSLSIEQVDPVATVALRRAVLRPHESLAEVAAASDLPGVFAIAALLERVVVCCALGVPEPWPDDPAKASSWRLRGMATAAGHRGAGLGTRVLTRVVNEVGLRDGELIWCNVRTAARTLYERAGFTAIGTAWTDPQIGPHVRMWRPV